MSNGFGIAPPPRGAGRRGKHTYHTKGCGCTVSVMLSERENGVNRISAPPNRHARLSSLLKLDSRASLNPAVIALRILFQKDEFPDVLELVARS
jgi:hypothetical protein